MLAFMHLLELLSSRSGQTLQERDDQGEDSHRSKRPEPNQRELPERL
jgi:hypothetical protein